MTLEKSIFVKRPVAAAFRHFTADIGRWWPLKEGMSFGGDRAHELFLEGKLGGRFYERFVDGEELDIGRVTAYEPPGRVAFTWRPKTWNADTEVEVRFAAEGDGTRVTLAHRGWEKLTAAVREANTGYDKGWDFALSRFAA
ncbi:MAG TPA: SRPBCC domain-containing protein [Myxococcota bacterium]|nr:SRPBCC domain-containing protein [Myxococcota bacterium]